MQADQLGLGYLTQSGYTGEGLLTSLKKIRSKTWYGSDQIPTYLNTHPAAEQRMSYIDNWLHQNRAQTTAKRSPVGGFELAQTRIIALYTNTELAMNHFQKAVKRSPEDPMANYGYALALTRKDQWHDAAKYMQKAIESNALATYMLQDLGKIYFHEGTFEKALEALSSSNSSKDPEGQLYLGRTQMELKQFAEAKATFEKLVHYHQDYTQAYYYLGESSGRMGDMFGAHYNLGRFYQRKADMRNAGFHLNRAMKLATNETQKQMVERELETLESQKKDRKKKPSG
jgi:predicted Zn-dependent protease